MTSVKIKNCHFNLEKNLQDFVIYTMHKLLMLNAIPEDELEKLQQKDYCKETFDLDFPLLTKNPTEFNKDKKHPRYYSKETFFVNGFYLCNHWFDQDKKFADWLLKLSEICL